MKTTAKKWIMVIVVLAALVWAFLSGYMVYRVLILQNTLASRACSSLTSIYQTVDDSDLYIGNYISLRDYQYDNVREALSDLELLSGDRYPSIEKYLWECWQLSRLVADNRISDEERETVRLQLIEYAELTYTYDGLEKSISREKRLKEIEKDLYEKIEVNEESRIVFGELHETLNRFEHRDDILEDDEDIQSLIQHYASDPQAWMDWFYSQTEDEQKRLEEWLVWYEGLRPEDREKISLNPFF